MKTIDLSKYIKNDGKTEKECFEDLQKKQKQVIKHWIKQKVLVRK